jgi:poly-gamma-glutamate synthesis protein (capsule biosynthesis protein)
MQLLCVGDLAISRDEKVIPCLGNRFGGMDPGDDWRIVLNWELPIGDRMNPAPRISGPRLLAHKNSLEAIRKWSPGFVTLATNHILDAGEGGLNNTIESLKRSGFQTVGAGQTKEEINQPLLWETGEGRLALFNWVFPETHPDWMAVPGPNCWPGLKTAGRLIEESRKIAHWVVILVHWSDELFPYPRPEDRIMGRQLAQLAADLVVGHHPHVVRGVEVFGDCPIFYSIGNFYFSKISDPRSGITVRQAPRNRESLGVRISLRRGEKAEYQTLSFWQKGRQTLLDGKRRAEKRMDEVSQPLRLISDAAYEAWYKQQRARFDKWGYRLHFRGWELGLSGLARSIWARTFLTITGKQSA